MKLLAIALLCAMLATADEAADRTSIDAVIHSLKTAQPVSSLFTADADSDLARLQALEQRLNAAVHTPWSEAGPPALVIDSMRFLTDDVVLVNAAEMQIGPMPRKFPVLFVMKRETSGWKIASLKMLDASGLVLVRP